MEELNANMLDIINAYNENDDEIKKSLVNLFGEDIGKYDYHDIKNTGRGAVRLHFRVKYE